jgi:hypothetical protein
MVGSWSREGGREARGGLVAGCAGVAGLLAEAEEEEKEEDEVDEDEGKEGETCCLGEGSFREDLRDCRV